MARPVRPFEECYERRGGEECWPWLLGLRNGYGRYCVGGRQVSASRHALELKLGRPIRKGKRALHTCDNPPCVNPAHLYEGTDTQNARDRERRGRGREQHGTASHLAKLTENDAAAIRARYATGGVTYAEIAADYPAVTKAAIGKIVRGDKWTHVEGPTERRRAGRPSRLDAAAVKKIRARYATGKVTQRALADEYGVTQPYISLLIHQQPRRRRTARRARAAPPRP